MEHLNQVKMDTSLGKLWQGQGWNGERERIHWKLSFKHKYASLGFQPTFSMGSG